MDSQLFTACSACLFVVSTSLLILSNRAYGITRKIGCGVWMQQSPGFVFVCHGYHGCSVSVWTRYCFSCNHFKGKNFIDLLKLTNHVVCSVFGTPFDREVW
jgi:hypothetical protein